jgi:hypothetical protein
MIIITMHHKHRTSGLCNLPDLHHHPVIADVLPAYLM